MIWVKWKRPFPGTTTYWSAEPQGRPNQGSMDGPRRSSTKITHFKLENFPDNMRARIRDKLDRKEIWPYPSRLCGDHKWYERALECERQGMLQPMIHS